MLSDEATYYRGTEWLMGEVAETCLPVGRKPARAPIRRSPHEIGLLADQLPRTRDVSEGKMRHDEGLTMGSFRLKLVGYFLLLALIPLAGFFFGFRQVAERSETRRVDARIQAGLRASSAALQEGIASA